VSFLDAYHPGADTLAAAHRAAMLIGPGMDAEDVVRCLCCHRSGARVVDVPAKLAVRVWRFDSGHNRVIDAREAHSVAAVAVCTRGLRVLAGLAGGTVGRE
jgi:hypothetical protein